MREYKNAGKRLKDREGLRQRFTHLLRQHVILWKQEWDEFIQLWDAYGLNRKVRLQLYDGLKLTRGKRAQEYYADIFENLATPPPLEVMFIGYL